MGASSMLDQVISFSDDVDARVVTIVLNKESERLVITADGAPGIEFSTAALRRSNGGIVNDQTARTVLNDQLKRRR